MALTQKEIEDILNRTKDEANLQLPQLQERLGAYNEAKGLQAPQEVKRTEDFVNQLAATMKSQQGGTYSDQGYRDAARYLVNASLDQTGIDSGEFAAKLQSGNNNRATYNYAKDTLAQKYLDDARGGRNEFMGTTNVNVYPNAQNDIDRLNLQIKPLVADQQAQSELDTTLGALPGQLQDSRDEYIRGELNRAKQVYDERVAPSVLNNLNVRGLLQSGDRLSSLAGAAAETFSPVQDKALQMEQEDNNFYQNAAYQATLKKELQGVSSARDYVAGQQSDISQSRSLNFQRAQADLARTYDESLFNRQQQTALTAQQAALKRQKDAADAASRNAIYGELGKVGGSIAGASIGGPAGGLVGMQAGQGLLT